MFQRTGTPLKKINNNKKKSLSLQGKCAKSYKYELKN